MKKQLKELREYFEAKILKGEFEVVEIGRYTADIEIEGEPFSIWISNATSQCRTYEGAKNAIDIDFVDKEAVHNVLEAMRTSDKNKSYLDEKRKEFEALKKELNIE